ncbi:hypothetical protein GJ496_007353 [Pomphorhynchus laevis]|nr:hypothetical protein GJ496_007353 [Pomphorhynchus laevis]
MILPSSHRVTNEVDCNKELSGEQTRQLSILSNNADYLGLLVFLEKFSVPLGLYEYSLRSLETGIISSEEVFTSLGMQELHFQFLKRIHVCRSITRNKVLKFISKFANTYGLSHIADQLNESESYESLSPETRLLLLKTVVDCQLDENSRLRTFLSEQPADCVRSTPVGKDKNGICYWFFEDSEYSVRLFNENLAIEQRPINLIASDPQSVLKFIEMLVADIQLQNKFKSWIPENFRDVSIVNVVMENIILHIEEMLIASDIQDNKEEVSKQTPRRSRRTNPKRSTVMKMHKKKSIYSDTGDKDDKDFYPDQSIYKAVKQKVNGVYYDTNCRKCHNPQSEDIVLLCDGCNDPYHPGCLLPQLIDIPEGDWFCPICDQKNLCEILSKRLNHITLALEEVDKKKAASAIARQNRLANVQANIENLIMKAQIETVDTAKPKARTVYTSEDDADSYSNLSDYSTNKFGAGRTRRARNNVNYRFDDYDAALKEAIGEASSESDQDRNLSDVVDPDIDSVRKKSVDRDFTLYDNESISYQSSNNSSIGQEDFDIDSNDEQWNPMHQHHQKKRAKRKQYAMTATNGSSDNDSLPGWKSATTRNVGRARHPALRRSTRKAAQTCQPLYYDDSESNVSTADSSSQDISSQESDDYRSTSAKRSTRRVARPIDESSSSSSGSAIAEPLTTAQTNDDILWKRRLQLNQYDENSKLQMKEIIRRKNNEVDNEKFNFPVKTELTSSEAKPPQSILVRRYLMPDKSCRNKQYPIVNVAGTDSYGRKLLERTIIQPLSNPVSLLNNLNITSANITQPSSDFVADVDKSENAQDFNATISRLNNSLVRPQSPTATNSFSHQQHHNAVTGGSAFLKGYVPRAIRSTPFLLSENSFTLYKRPSKQQSSHKSDDLAINCDDSLDNDGEKDDGCGATHSEKDSYIHSSNCDKSDHTVGDPVQANNKTDQDSTNIATED